MDPLHSALQTSLLSIARMALFSTTTLANFSAMTLAKFLDKMLLSERELLEDDAVFGSDVEGGGPVAELAFRDLVRYVSGFFRATERLTSVLLAVFGGQRIEA